MTDQHPVRTYGGWRRSRSIGLLGLAPTATFTLLGCFAVLLVLVTISLRLLLYVAPPAVLAGAAGLVRVGGILLAQLAVQRVRWWHGTRAGHTSYRADVVQQHTGVLQLPGTLAATELVSAEDGQGGRYGLARDRHTGYLTATIRVAPVSTWLADPADADQWVANWGTWLASLGYLPALRWVTVTVGSAPDPGFTLTSQIAQAIDPAAPRPALDLMGDIAATAPAAAADVETWVSITFDPAAFPAQPATIDEAVTETGRALLGLESALGACGVSVLGRARAADLAGMVRAAFDPAARAEISRLLATPMSAGLQAHLDWPGRRAGRGRGTLGLLPARQRHLGDLGLAGAAPAERHLHRARPPARPGRLPQASQPAIPAAARRRGRPHPGQWCGRQSSAASTPAGPAAT